MESRQARYVKIQEKIYIGAATRPALYGALVEFDVPKMRVERLLQLAEIGLAAENAMRSMPSPTHARSPSPAPATVPAPVPAPASVSAPGEPVKTDNPAAAELADGHVHAARQELQASGGLVKIGAREGSAMSRYIK